MSMHSRGRSPLRWLWPLAVAAAAALALTSARIFGGGAGAPAVPAPDDDAPYETTFEGDLQEPVSEGWLRGMLVPAILLAVAALAFLAWRMWSGSGGPAAAGETAVAERMTIRSTIETSASVDTRDSADLSFAMPGRVASVNVKLGDAVQQGQTLATLDGGSLDSAVAAAEANLYLARLKLTQLLNGASYAEIAAAEQSVSSARAARDAAADDLRRLQQGAEAADVEAARASVTKAEAALAESEEARRIVGEGASAAEVAAAEAGVTAAQVALTGAEQAATDAQAGIAAAEGDLLGARAQYCQHTEARDEVCASIAIPIAQPVISALLGDAGATSDVALAGHIGTLLGANGLYVGALQSTASAAGAVDIAEANLAAAEEKLARLQDGAEPGAIAAADAAVAAARDGVLAARGRLADVEAGATPEEVAVAKSALRAAEDALSAAEAKLADMEDGADADDIAIQRGQVAAAEVAVERAKVERREATLEAPFAGVVAAIDIQPGEYAAPGKAAIVLLTPDALALELVVGETDRPRVEAGQEGSVTFEALPNETFAFTIRRVGETPEIVQGVAIYTAEASLMIPAGGTRPVPGIGGTAEVLIEERKDVVAVPSRGLRRLGRAYVVSVMRDGVVEDREVVPGISDGQYVEITSGLEAGETVVLRAPEKAAAQGLPTRERRLPGDIR